MPTLDDPIYVPASGVGAVVAEVPVVPPMFPTDPEPVDQPAEITASPLGPLIQVVILSEQGTRVLGDLETARVSSCSEELGEVGSAQISCSTWDYGLPYLFGGDRFDHLGREVAPLTVADRQVLILRDGVVIWRGIPDGESRVSNGSLSFTCSTLEALWGRRVNGPAERRDLLNGAGSFESGFGPFVADAGATAEIVTDGVRGTKALRIKGRGKRVYVQVTTGGINGRNLAITGSGFVKVPPTVDGTLLMRVVVVNPSTGSYYSLPFSNEHSAETGSDTVFDTWSESPIVALGALAPAPVMSRVIVELYGVDDDEWTYFDLVRLQKNDAVGSATPIDLSNYVPLLIQKAQYAFGKSSWNQGWNVRSLTGTVESIRWLDQDHAPLPDCLASLMDRVDGPDIWVDLHNVVQVAARRGSTRTDVAFLDEDCVGDLSWSIDPKSQATSLIGLTDRGDGVARVEAGAQDLEAANGEVIDRIVRVPNGMTLNQVDRFIVGQLAVQSKPQKTATATVPWSYGRLIGVGDTVRCVLVDGTLAIAEPLRVVTRTFNPDADTYTFTLGPVQESMN